MSQLTKNESVQVFYRLFICVLSLEIQLLVKQDEEFWIPWTVWSCHHMVLHIISQVLDFLMINDLRWEVCLRFVDIDEIVDRHCS
jgi:hypothetical protein